MGKLVFAALVFVVGFLAYAALRRQGTRFGTGPLALVPKAVLALAIAIPALIFTFSIFRIIPAGEVGVKVLFGQVDPVPLREGLNVLWNPLYDIVTMDTRVLKHTARYDAASKDLQAVHVRRPARPRGRATTSALVGPAPGGLVARQERGSALDPAHPARLTGSVVSTGPTMRWPPP